MKKKKNANGGDVACPGSSVVEHQPRLWRVSGSIPDSGAFAILSVRGKASLPFPFSFPSGFLA